MQIKDYQIVILGVLIAIGSVFSTYILANSIVEFQKLQNQTIRVTGSASEKITSDSASWNIDIRTKQPSLKQGYAKLKQDSEKVKRLMRSYARNQGTQTPNTVLAEDTRYNDGTAINEETVASYVSALKKIFVIEDVPAWNPNLRSKTAIRTTDTRYYVDRWEQGQKI